MSLKGADIDRMWKKLGFITKNSGDIHAKLVVDGRAVKFTKRSMGSGNLDGNIPNFIRRQMGLTQDQFADAVNCPLKRDGYIQILRDKGDI
jgi:hypothetical protein